MKRDELVLRAKELNIKGASRMRKNELINIIKSLHQYATWFNNIIDNKIIINDDDDFDLEIIDLDKPDLTDFKMWDIDKDKQKWLLS